METGKLIKDLRLKKGMTQDELAEKTEVSTRTIQRIENGDVDPRAYTLQMIAKALEVDYNLFTHCKSDENEIQATNRNQCLALLSISGIVPLIFPTVLIWNSKKNKIPGLSDHYRAVVSFQLMILGVILGCLWVYWKVGILTPLYGVLFANVLFSIFGAMQAMSGKSFKPGPFKTREKVE